ncbi:Cupin domain-containing protein [Thalassovita litoralis]|jgi:quercetin dioxygenase-like cupin family protein|uniref:Cupin domain-containing protein n=1 Tax=Thalassovita litoralis TaxID=1010611 RepID=A0A521FIH7_9RHOB|nr:cupin domain-containing protein [Thalassovita litoralis]SMO96013.1 Cupin domain-containing protein [Thalassovita litoralis]
MPFPSTAAATATVLAEDDRTKVTRWDFEPGATTGWHEHEMDYAVVILTDSIMAYEVDGEITEKPVKPGDSYLRPKGVQHDVKNAGPGMLSFVEIEMKR